METPLEKLSEAIDTVEEIAEIELERADHATLGSAPIHRWNHSRLIETAGQLREVRNQLAESSN